MGCQIPFHRVRPGAVARGGGTGRQSQAAVIVNAAGIIGSFRRAHERVTRINQRSNNPLPFFRDVLEIRPQRRAASVFDVASENSFDFLSDEYRALFENSRATAFQNPLWLDRLYASLAPRLD